MGYNTSFKGTLKFKRPLKLSEYKYISKYLGEDGRDHTNWKSNSYYMKDWYFIDLEFEETDEDFIGLKWDGSEKTYGMVNQINFLIYEINKKFPELLPLSGKLLAQGEEVGDVYNVVIGADGLAKVSTVETLTLQSTEVQCPCCKHKFNIN